MLLLHHQLTVDKLENVVRAVHPLDGPAGHEDSPLAAHVATLLAQLQPSVVHESAEETGKLRHLVVVEKHHGEVRDHALGVDDEHACEVQPSRLCHRESAEPCVPGDQVD